MTATKLSRKDQRRRCVLVHELARLSRDGWRNAKPCDYRPLEAELAALRSKAED